MSYLGLHLYLTKAGQFTYSIEYFLVGASIPELQGHGNFFRFRLCKVSKTSLVRKILQTWNRKSAELLKKKIRAKLCL